MYYEFYIDQFFLEHLLTGFLLIAVALRIGRKRVSWARTAAGSAANAAVMTFMVCLGLPGGYGAGLLSAGLILFAGKGWRQLLEGFFFLLLAAVCFGGVLEILLGWFGLPLMAGTAAAVLLLELAARFLDRRRALEDSLVTVRLQWEERTEVLCGMIDTGNQLTEPLTGRPVSIVESGPARRLLGEGWEERRGFYLIPYHSIGTRKGWMRGVTIDRMTVELPAGTAVVKRPVLAVCGDSVSARNRYQMILHPLHARSEG